MITHELILASAGTGKTFRLTNRLIALLAHGHAPDSILASTFTRKAAGEILARVLGVLSGAASDPARLDELRKHTGVQDLDAERCAELLDELAACLPRLGVMTIDSFLARAARCFTLELGVPGGIPIAEDHADEELRVEALARVVGEQDVDTLTDLVVMLHGDLPGRSVVGTLLDAMQDGYEAFIETCERPETWGQPTVPSGGTLDDDALCQCAAALESLDLPRKRDGTQDSRWARANQTAIDHLRARNWEGLLGSGIAKNLSAADLGDGDAKYCSSPIPPEIRAAYMPAVEHARRVLLDRARRRTMATFELLARFDESYTALKRRRGMYRHEDVPRMLARAGATGLANLLYYRLDGAVHHVLLDEFQDTSRLQFELLEPMLDEMLAQHDGRSVFIVGDVKQSLYGWRQAEPGLLEHLPDRWSSLEVGTMDESYRSSPVVLDAVNRVFCSLEAHPKLVEAGQRWRSRFHSHVASSLTEHLPGWAELSVAGAPRQDRPEGQPELEDAPPAPPEPPDPPDPPDPLTIACERVASLRHRVPWARIAILLRKNKHTARAIHTLAQLGVPASQEGGAPVTDAAAVAAIVSAFRLAQHPGDSAAAFHVGTSPLAPRLRIENPLDPSNARDASMAVRRRLLLAGYAHTVAWLGDQCRAVMSRRELDRFEQLVSLGWRADAIGVAPASPGVFVRMVESTRLDAPGAEPVRVMTVHASKGLEFDAVILPELDEPLNGRHGAIIVDRPDPVGRAHAVCRWPNELLRRLDVDLDEIHDRHQRKQIDEQLCTLYVAMTRAVHHLEMIISPRDKADPKGDISDLLRVTLAPGVVPEPGARLWCDGDEAWPARASRAADHADAEPIEPEPVTLRLARSSPGRAGADRLAIRSPSQLAGVGGDWRGGGVDLRERLGLESRSLRARIGSIVHGWFELIGWIEDGVPSDPALIDAARAHGVDEHEAQALVPEFRRTLEQPEVASALSRASHEDSESVRLDRERGFAVRFEPEPGDEHAEPCIVSGRFDRLVFVPGLWGEVLDFKTDAVGADEGSLRARVEAHRPQLDAYRRAAASMLGLAPDRVRARIVFTAVGRVVEVPQAREGACDG